MRELPAPSAITLYTVFGSSPAFIASTNASAAETLWMATSRLATSFIFVPLPNSPK